MYLKSRKTVLIQENRTIIKGVRAKKTKTNFEKFVRVLKYSVFFAVFAKYAKYPFKFHVMKG